MNLQPICNLFLCGLLFFCQHASAQYILNGTAQKVSCNCYTLTEERQRESGSVWNSNKINLTNSFDYRFNVFLGCRDVDGADGIVFILQPISTSVGASGEGMGFDGVSPSVGIALDTWQNFNLNDPVFDHISIQANGNTNHTNDLTGPVQASLSSANIEDCKWHVLRIAWDAATKTLTAYFDGAKRVETQVDLVTTIFNNDPNVYWGFTGATGGSVNLQQFCTALNPIVSASSAVNRVCEGSPIQFVDASESFAPIVGYNWSFGDGSTSTEKNPPPHLYARAGNYPVNLTIKAQDGCEKDSTFTVTVGSVPQVAMEVADTCIGETPRLQLKENNTAVSYSWALDGVTFSNEKDPQLPPLQTGVHRLQVVATSDFNCGQPAIASTDFTIKPRPELSAQVEDGCTGETVFFKGLQLDNSTTISRWQWDLGDGSGATLQTVDHVYNRPGQFVIGLSALATNGCVSFPFDTAVIISQALAFAGNDTAVIKGEPFQLQGAGNGSFLWSPSTGLSDPFVSSPVATLDNDQRYLLTVVTPEGCQAKDTVLVRTFKGPAIYVPTAFTPNGDGRNDGVRPVYVGIKELREFAVFNRWGQRLFSTKDRNKGWDGKGEPTGTYVWFIQAVDASGKTIVVKGTVMLIR